MKASEKILGQELQVFLLRQGKPLEALAQQMKMTSEGLSNLIHGRRRFKDDTLKRLSETAIMKEGEFSLQKLKALRAMDEYSMSELVLAVVEFVKRGEIERLPADFFDQIRHELDQNSLPPGLARKRRELIELVESTRA